ncbi:hypothetical protein [Lactobacillus intestinalis]|uniref:Lipoprotein n=1 Tax=Lactobacillus intestinalis DSM 6629 TaxID=1423761 RepID=A0ABR5PQ21_9LACO|nr:hypothetical protein [Lactobacillus intestinalis]KRM32764.1 hypothetical protein FC44_GL001567 [Lactobacillus intestinalis DSM 6629]UTW41336.1 hypothetical protein KBW87_09555 [Lactobacillus intestinalis]
MKRKKEQAAKKKAEEEEKKKEEKLAAQRKAKEKKLHAEKNKEEAIKKKKAEHKKQNSTNDKKFVQKKKDSPSKSYLLSRAKKLEFGMSLATVKHVMKVKPTKEEKDEAGYNTLMYGHYVVYLSFDKNNNLLEAMSGAPQIEKQAEEASQKKKMHKTANESNLKSLAQYFGQKSSESIQHNPYAFKTTQDGDLLYILWNPGQHLPLLLRIDDASTNITNVYIYNKHGDNPRGRHLYTGRTIIQKNRTPIYY